MAAIDIGEARALARKARDEALKLGAKAWARAPGTVSKLMEEPRSFVASFRAPPPPPPKTPWAHLAGMAAIGFIVGAAALGGRKAVRQIGAVGAADWLTVLKGDREAAEKIFDSLLATGDSELARRKFLMTKLASALTRRAIELENVLYPALREANRELAARRLAEAHFDIRSGLYTLSEAPRGEAEFLTKVQALRMLVAAHARDEEELYPPFQAGLSPEQNLKLTRALTREGLKLV